MPSTMISEFSLNALRCYSLRQKHQSTASKRNLETRRPRRGNGMVHKTSMLFRPNEWPVLGLGCVQTDRSARGRGRQSLQAADVLVSDRPVTGESGYRDAVLRFWTHFRPSGGADGCDQARFADDVHHSCEVIGENMQRHLGGDVP